MVASHLDRIVYLNGKFIPASEAKISIFDRGLLFADAVYEGFGVIDTRIIDIDVHLGRLTRSLAELNIPAPMETTAVADILRQLVNVNAMVVGFLYLHITRGESDRDYLYRADIQPNVFAFVQPFENTDEEYKCSVKAANGNDRAKDELVKRNLRFVISVAKQFNVNNVSTEDLVNAGNIGLINAATKFDPTLGFKFISFAVFYIRTEIYAYLTNKSRIVRMPRNQVQDISQFNEKFTKLEQKLQRPVEEADMLKAHSDYSLKKIRSLMHLRLNNMDSLDANINDVTGNYSRYEIIEDTSLPTIAEILNDKDRKAYINSLLLELSDEELEVINKFYGLNGYYSRTMIEIGKELNITKVKVRCIKTKAILKIKRIFNKNLKK